MPIEIKDCDGGLGNIIVGRGIVTDKELIDALKRHLTQDKEKFKKYRYSFSDYTAETKMNISSETIKFIAQQCKEASKINSDAIVATVATNDLIYGLSRMAEALMYETGWETMVFRSKKKAVEWIKERVKDKFEIDDLTFS